VYCTDTTHADSQLLYSVCINPDMTLVSLNMYCTDTTHADSQLLYSVCINSDMTLVSLLSDFPKDLIYVPCGISQDWIVRLPSLSALHKKKEDSKVPNVYFSEPSI